MKNVILNKTNSMAESVTHNNAHIKGDLSVDGSTNLKGDLTIDGTTNFDGGVDLGTNTVTINTTVTFEGDADRATTIELQRIGSMVTIFSPNRFGITNSGGPAVLNSGTPVIPEGFRPPLDVLISLVAVDATNPTIGSAIIYPSGIITIGIGIGATGFVAGTSAYNDIMGSYVAA